MILTIIMLVVFNFVWMGIALHLGRTIEKMDDRINELERDYFDANQKLASYEKRI